MISMAPASLYFLGVFIIHLLSPGIYFSGKVTARQSGLGMSTLPASFDVNLSNLAININCYVSIRHVGLSKPSTAYYTSRSTRYPNSVSTFQLAKLVVSGDISTNPGPEKCTMCSRTIARNHRALRCVLCTSQCHIKCGGVKPEEYNRLQQSVNNKVWTCPCVFRAI